jgi:hypothetical protein
MLPLQNLPLFKIAAPCKASAPKYLSNTGTAKYTFFINCCYKLILEGKVLCQKENLIQRDDPNTQ